MKRIHFHQPPPRALGPEAGFTLTELMVALVILAVGILSAGSLFVFSQRHAFSGRTETMAACLAEEIREKILSENFEDIQTIFDGVDTKYPETVTLPCQDWANHLTQGLGPSGRGILQVMHDDEDPDITDGMLSLVIDVSWQEGNQRPEVVLRFAISQMGVQS